ncbi:hypothetical protein [Methylovulum miyakonense]|uniref:hypothetical protein n=1 Tax=Methylovulum miyakonense TaxID=645578 RepID=UPI00037C2547|nr:hypothetical protein [Methylovulum miyakonense]
MLKASLALSLLLLAGCAGFSNSWNGNPGAYSEPYAQADFDELLAFGAMMAKIPPSSRSDTCRTLLKRQQEAPGAGFQLHLMVGRLLSDTCGDIPKILDGVNAIPAQNLTDIRLQKLLAIDTETLRRINSLPVILSNCPTKKTGSPKRKQKSAPTSPADEKETAVPKDDENRLLREKLEAIRSMEKHLDESGGGN